MPEGPLAAKVCAVLACRAYTDGLISLEDVLDAGVTVDALQARITNSAIT